MIALIVPTFNRAYALEQVLDTFYVQKYVSEIVFVDDCGQDNSEEVIKSFSTKYPNVKTIYLRNESRSGASFSRWKGVENSTAPFILFCDDDEFLEANYSEVCLNKIRMKKGDIVSGRHMYRLVGESTSEAIKRFGNGLIHQNPFGMIRLKVYTDAIFCNDIQIPFTHGIYMTTRDLLYKFKMDPFYAKGNGFREESDFQLNAYLNNYKVLVTNDTHCVHMNMSEVRSGGQRVNRLVRYCYNIRYTHYFLRKYFEGLKTRHNIPYGFKTAVVLYSIAEFYDFFIRPFYVLYKRVGGN